MRSVNVHEAKTQLSKILEEVEAGNEVIIARAGVPVAVVKPYREASAPRRFDTSKGQVKIAADFDELPEDMMRAFSGEAP